MPGEIRVPTMGESIVDAVIASWLKHEGDSVSQGEALVELETDKVNVEVTAEQSGVLQKIVKQEGDTVAVGEVLGVIGEGAGTGGGTPASAALGNGQNVQQEQGQLQPMQTTRDEEQRVPTSPLPSEQVANEEQPAAGQLQAAQAGQATQGRSDGQRPPSPLARRIAADYNVDIPQIRGTSPHGRITKNDVINYMEQSTQKT